MLNPKNRIRPQIYTTTPEKVAGTIGFSGRHDHVFSGENEDATSNFNRARSPFLLDTMLLSGQDDDPNPNLHPFPPPLQPHNPTRNLPL
jgi:hypothetical protein